MPRSSSRWLLLAVLSGCDTKETITDNDRDGFQAAIDCDDSDPSIFPGAPELCDDIDNDCDGVADVGAADGEAYFVDYDGDGYGNPALSQWACDPPGDGFVENGEDCDDMHASAYPGGEEVCDGVDNDCDGETDVSAADTTLFYRDSDGDGYGDPAVSLRGCEPPAGYVGNGADCDDQDAAISPKTRWFPDRDGDGYGEAFFSIVSCSPPEGHVLLAEDCDDDDPSIYPGAKEICDGADTNCDGLVEAEDADSDGDGQPICGGDCDDDNPSVYVGAEEVCGDEIDDDCDGLLTNSCPNSVQDAEHKIAGEGSLDYFGFSLACTDSDQDGSDDLLVGAYGNDDGGTNAGKAYLFRGPLSVIKADDAYASFAGEVASGFLGASAAAGDLDGDGYGDIIIGAYAEEAGTAYVFYGPTSGAYTTSSADAALTATGSTGDLSRYLLSAQDDLDGDGDAELIIGAHNHNGGMGAVAIFLEPSGEADVEEADVLFAGTTASGYAGYGAAIVGDIDGDGSNDMVFGEPNANQAYLVYGPISATIDQADADIVFDNTDRAGDYIGSRVGGGDLDGDGRDDVVISSKYDDTAASSAGAVAVFFAPSDSEIDLYDADAFIYGDLDYAYFGQQTDALSILDLNDDGTDDLMIGSSSEDSLHNNGGAVFTYFGPISGAVTTASYDFGVFGSDAYQYVGRTSVAVSDFNGDKQTDMIVGSYAFSASTGRVFMFSGSSF